MEFKVEHPHFVENEITWEISGLKSTLKYKGNPVKLKWGKTKLLDDYGGGALGAVFAVANIYFVRNTFLTDKPMGTKIGLSLLSTVGGILLLFAIAIILTILIRGF